MAWTITPETEQATQIEAAAARQGMTPEEFMVSAALRAASAVDDVPQPRNGHATANGAGTAHQDAPSGPVPPWAEPLAQAAQRNDEAGFIAALRDVDRDRLTAADWQLLSQLALTAGAHIQARELAQEGARRFPDDVWLQKRAYLLAPPRVLRRTPVDPATAAAVQADHEWMKAHWAEHRGEWIALHAGQLLGTAPTLRELREKLSRAAVQVTDNPFVTKIY